jgi:hypothetical protein
MTRYRKHRRLGFSRLHTLLIMLGCGAYVARRR